MNESRSSKEKVALVTGGASGLGKAIACRLRSDGARVLITDRDAVLGRRTADGEGLVFVQQDVCDERRWAEVIQEAEVRLGPLSVLVNNAGITGPMDAVTPEDTRLEDWRTIFAVNVEGVFLGCRAAIAAMRRTGGGSIINVSSVAALLATSRGTAYGASKAAVRQLTKSVAQHCAEQGLNIRCNSVHPGTVLTPIMQEAMAGMARARGVPIETVLAELKNNIPMGQFPLPDDIAAAVAFLVSDESRYMTGARLVVDGGRVHCDTFRRDLQGDGLPVPVRSGVS